MTYSIHWIFNTPFTGFKTFCVFRFAFCGFRISDQRLLPGNFKLFQQISGINRIGEYFTLSPTAWAGLHPLPLLFRFFAEPNLFQRICPQVTDNARIELASGYPAVDTLLQKGRSLYNSIATRNYAGAFPESS